MKILIIHNPKVLGGSSKSLMLLVDELKNYQEIEFFFYISKGQFERYLKQNNFQYLSTNWISHFDNTRYGYYRGKRWLILLRELFHFPVSILKLVYILVNHKFDIILINDAPLVIYSYLIKKITKSKIVLYVRTVQNTHNNFRKRIFEKLLNKYVDHVIAIDNTVKKSLPESVYNKTTVIHNGFYKPDVNINSLHKNKKDNFFSIGYVGVIYDAKGILELLEAVKILVCDKKLTDIKLLIAGQLPRKVNNKILFKVFEKLGFSKDYMKIINSYIKEHNLVNNIEFLGYIEDLNRFYSRIDLLIFPSKLDAVGRPVFEAGFYGIPSIVAITNPLEDTFINMKTGLSIPYPEPYKLAEKIELLYKDRNLLKKLGQGAKELAESNFDIRKNASKFFNVIKELTGG